MTKRALSIKNDFYPLLKLAIPFSLTGILQASAGFIENIFLAHVSQNVLAAGALVSWLFGTIIVILFGTLGSVNILVAYKYGANDHHGISQVLRDGLLLAVFFLIPIILLFWYIAPIFLLFGQSPDVVLLAQSYLHALVWGLVPKFIMIVLLEFIMGLGHARVIMIFTILAIPFVIFFSFVLIFGKLGFPQLGIAGAGWGMAISDWLTSIGLILYIISRVNYRSYVQHIFQLRKPFFVKELLQVGLPIGLMYCTEVAFFLALTLLMGTMGSAVLAANQVTMQYLCALMSVIFSIAQAVTVRMGHQLGANDILSAKQTCYAGMCVATIFMSIIAIFYWLIPGVLIGIDFDVHDPENAVIVSHAKQFIIVCGFFQIFEGTRIALFGALRGLKDTHFPLLASIISFWCIALPIGYLTSITLHYGGTGFWWSMVLGASLSAIALFVRVTFKIKNKVKGSK